MLNQQRKVSLLMDGTSAFRLFMALIVCVIFEVSLPSCSTNVQNRRPIPETIKVKPADHILLEMEVDLNLTNEQVEKIRPIIEEQVKKRKELIQKFQDRGQAGRGALQAELKDLRINTSNQLQYYLTNDQMIKYGNMQQEEDKKIVREKPGEQGSQQMRKGRGGSPGGP